MELSAEVIRLNTVVNDFQGSQRALAEILGISHVSLGRMMKGTQPITYEVVKKICIDLGYSPSWLIRGEGSPRVAKSKENKLIADLSQLKTEIQIANKSIEVLFMRLNKLEQQNEKKAS